MTVSQLPVSRLAITGFSNPAVKAARALRDKKHRKREGRFLAEGLRLLTEAREAGVVPEALWVNQARDPHPLVDALERAVSAGGGVIYETSADILSKISGKDNPQTVLGVFADLPTSLDRLDRSQSGIWLVAQALRDPGNLGTMMRTCDAVGAGGLILLDQTVDPFSVEAVRASMGAVFTVPLVQAEWSDFLTWLRAGAGQLVGTSLNTQAGYRSASYIRPCFLLIGNEAQGLPVDYEGQCDLLVKIPMLGKADSLNAAVAAAVMAYEVLAQQHG